VIAQKIGRFRLIAIQKERQRLLPVVGGEYPKKYKFNTNLTFAWHRPSVKAAILKRGDQMTGIEWHYILGGLAILIGSVGFIKFFDFLASQAARRLLEIACRNHS
jgi:hypothetical protein